MNTQFAKHGLLCLALVSWSHLVRAGECASGESSRLATQAVNLAREAVAVEMPAEMPSYLSRYFPGGQEDYSRKVSRPGASFLDPILVRRIAPSLYRRLSGHYRCSWAKLARSLVCLPGAYASEPDERVKDRLAEYTLEVSNEVALDMKDCHFLMNSLLEMIAGEKDSLRRKDLWQSLNELDAASYRETDFPALMAIMDTTGANEDSWSDIFDVLATMLLVARRTDPSGHNAAPIVQFVLDLTSGQDAPLLARVYFARDADLYAASRHAETERRLFNWLRESLATGGDKVSDTIIWHFGGSAEYYDRLVPFLIQSLESARVETRCTAITFIGRMTHVAPPNNHWGGVPYRTSLAMEVPKKDWPASYEEEWEEEQQKAIQYWRAWWASNRVKYETPNAALDGVAPGPDGK